jgi:Holliday junction resolvase-like predicted endonuclease
LAHWHVATAAEAIAAAQFARFGFDVSVQYGANQPEYDLTIAASGGKVLRISVKGSKNGGWGLSQSQLARIRNANYHGAADAWLERHKSRTAICLVQFKNVPDDALPRVYLAWPKEIAGRLKAASAGRGDTRIWEDHTHCTKAFATGTIEKIPDDWKLTKARVAQFLDELG